MRVIDLEFAEKDRQAFRLYAQEGRGVNETAEALGMSVDQVYQAKSRILKRLATVVAAQLEAESSAEAGDIGGAAGERPA